MRRTIARLLRVLLSIAAAASAAPPQLSLSGIPVRPNQQANLEVTLAGGTESNLAGLQWTVTLPAGTVPIVVTGAAANTAAKTVTCGQAGTTTLTCIAAGLNTNVFGDGVIAILQFVPLAAGTLNFALSGTLGATVDGNAAAVGAAVPFAYSVLSPCDVNGDQATDVADVTRSISQVLGATACTADLTGDGLCTITDLVRIINAALGQACKTGP